MGLGVEEVGKRREQRDVLIRRRFHDMLVDHCRAVEKCFEGIGAERQGGGEPDRGPQGVAAADTGGKGQDTGLIDAELDSAFGRGRDGDQAAVRVLDPRLLQPGEGGLGVAQGSEVVKVLEAIAMRVVAGSSRPSAASTAWPSMFDRISVR